MKRKGKRQRHLRRDLHKQRPGGHRGRDRSGLEVPAEDGSDEVRDAEEVEGPGEDAPGDAVECGQVPCYLRAVDGEMGGGGTVLALLDEDFVGVGGGELLRCRGGAVKAEECQQEVS